jgi:hypothetical protein
MMTRAEKIKAGKIWQIYPDTDPDDVLFEGSKTAAIKFAREHIGPRWRRNSKTRLGRLIWEPEDEQK